MNANSFDDSTIPFIAELAAAVHEHWSPAGYDELALPEAAHAAFRKHPLPDDLHATDVLTWSLTSPLPEQPSINSNFGQPPICLYCDEHFYIEMYVWRESTTSIHDHAFAGAFCVLNGSSLHVTHSFQPADVAQPSFQVGELAVENCEVLRRGDSRPIVAGGAGMIHAVFHLDHPSATLCIRNSRSRSIPFQRNYLAPTVAVDAFLQRKVRPEFYRRLAVSSAGYDLRDHRVIDATRRFVVEAEWFEAFTVVASIAAQHGLHTVEPLLETLHQRNESRTQAVIAAIQETARRADVIGLRSLVRDSESRFLLALLANLPDRATILDQIQKRYPKEDPVDRIGELYTATARSLSGQVPLCLWKMHEMHAFVLPFQLRDVSDESVVPLASAEACRHGLDFQPAALGATARAARHLNLLKPLFNVAASERLLGAA